MALVDWMGVVLDLQDFARTEGKTSFGQTELTTKIADLISEHRVPEGLPERAVRLYMDDLFANNPSPNGGGRSADAADSEDVTSIGHADNGVDEGVMPHGDRNKVPA